MILFHNDYSEGCHEKVLEKLISTNMEQTPGYGEDCYCASAAEKVRPVILLRKTALKGGTAHEIEAVQHLSEDQIKDNT